MTFEEFLSTRREAEDLGAVSGDGTLEGRPGFVYAEDICPLCIERVTDDWPADARSAGRYALCIGAMELLDPELAPLEEKLYDFAFDEGYFGHDPELVDAIARAAQNTLAEEAERIVEGALKVASGSVLDAPFVMAIARDWSDMDPASRAHHLRRCAAFATSRLLSADEATRTGIVDASTTGGKKTTLLELMILLIALLLPVGSDPRAQWISEDRSLVHRALWNGRDVDETQNKIWEATVRFSFLHAKCTGAMISPYTMLTAAHCLRFEDDRNNVMAVHFYRGSTVDSSRVVYWDDFRFVVHPRHHPELRFGANTDIGLILFRNSILPEGRAPASFLQPGEQTVVRKGQEMVVVGAGWAGEEQKNYDLRYLPGVIADISVHNNAYVEAQGGGVCSADSGSPLYFETNGQLRLVGVLADWIEDRAMGLIERYEGVACSDRGGLYRLFERAMYSWFEEVQSRRMSYFDR